MEQSTHSTAEQLSTASNTDAAVMQSALEFEQERLRLLLDLHKAEAGELDIRGLIQLLAPRLRRVMGCDFIGLAVPNPVSGDLRQELVDYPNSKGIVFEGMLVPMHGSASGKAFRTGELVCLESKESDALDPEIFGTVTGARFYQQVLKEGRPSGYFLPLLDESGVFGILQLKKYTGVALRPQEADFLSAVARQLSRAVRNALGRTWIAPPGGLAPWQMRRVTNKVENHPNGDVSISELAAECDLSVGHFTRAFRFTTGERPHCWVMNKRIERAKDLLASSAFSLAEVAQRCGFSDQAAFTRSFKKMSGKTPLVWRRDEKR